MNKDKNRSMSGAVIEALERRRDELQSRHDQNKRALEHQRKEYDERAERLNTLAKEVADDAQALTEIQAALSTDFLAEKQVKELEEQLIEVRELNE